MNYINRITLLTCIILCRLHTVAMEKRVKKTLKKVRITLRRQPRNTQTNQVLVQATEIDNKTRAANVQAQINRSAHPAAFSDF